ncbi:MAG: M48 family metallopeptidase [Dehalococcoidia bacterium]
MTLPATVDVTLPDGRVVSAQLRPSGRARIPRIRVGAQAPLHLVVPEGCSVDQAVDALELKAPWIARKLDEIERLRSEVVPLGLGRPETVWVAGLAIPVRRVQGAGAPRLRGGMLEVSGEQALAGEAIERWYRRQARAALGSVVGEEAGRLGISPGRIAIRDQRTRWGSCSSAGALSFSWRLVIAPPEVLRYVVVHELLHVRMANHSKTFWRALDASLPGWEEHARWLRCHGDELRSYRPRP